MPSAKYSFKLEGERQWNINRKSRVLTKHVPANGAPGNASGMVHMLMVQSQAEFFWGGAQDGEIRLSVWCQILVQNKSVGSRGLLRLKSPPRNKNSRGPVPCPSNCVNSSAASVRAKLPQRRWRSVKFRVVWVWETLGNPLQAPQKIALSLSP